MASAPKGPAPTPRAWAAVYRDEQQPAAARQQALGALVAAYAAEVADGQGPAEAGRTLAELLTPDVRRVALVVSQDATAAEREEFAQEALGLLVAPRSAKSLPRICLYRADRGELDPWLVTVLKNCWRSRRRRRGLPLSGSGLDWVPSPPDPGRELDLFAVWVKSFSLADLSRAAAWDARSRVELLCMGGLWFKVPPPLWEEWLRAYEAARNVAVVRPFPPAAFLNLDDPGARTAPLAGLLQYRRANTLSAYWNRVHEKLEELDFVRRLRDG